MSTPIPNQPTRPMRVVFHVPNTWQYQKEQLFMNALDQLAFTHGVKLICSEYSQIIALDDELPDDPHGTEAGLLDPAIAPPEITDSLPELPGQQLTSADFELNCCELVDPGWLSSALSREETFEPGEHATD